MEQWVEYLRGADLPKRLWAFKPRSEANAINGASVVLKKDGCKLRKLIMAVPTNYQWSDVRRRGDRGLGGGGSLSLLRAPGMELRVARCDESNAFSSVTLPEWMWPWMATPAILAILVWDLLCPSLRSQLHEWSLACPCCARLPMGLSYAVRILMSIDLEAGGGGAHHHAFD